MLLFSVVAATALAADTPRDALAEASEKTGLADRAIERIDTLRFAASRTEDVFAGVHVFDNEIGTGETEACRIEWEWSRSGNFQEVKQVGDDSECDNVRRMFSPQKFVSASLTPWRFTFTEARRTDDGGYALRLSRDCSGVNERDGVTTDLENLCLNTMDTLYLIRGQDGFVIDRVVSKMQRPTRLNWRRYVREYSQVMTFETVYLSGGLERYFGRDAFTYLKTRETKMFANNSLFTHADGVYREEFSRLSMPTIDLILADAAPAAPTAPVRPVVAVMPTDPAGCRSYDGGKVTVRLDLSVSAKGRPRGVEASGGRACFADLATEALARWRFEPREDAFETTIEMVFTPGREAEATVELR